MEVVPHPVGDAIPITAVESVDLAPGERAVLEVVPERSSTLLQVATVGVTHHDSTAFEVRSDGSTVYGPESIPPSRVDDPAPTWIPAIPVRSTLHVVVDDLRDSGDSRTYHAQPIGYEMTES